MKRCVELPPGSVGTDHRRFVVFWCQGCKERHHIIAPKPGCDHAWNFNENFEKPTFQPSIKVTGHQRICHTYVTDGRIQFLNDCTHALAGQTLDLPEVDEDGYELASPHPD